MRTGGVILLSVVSLLPPPLLLLLLAGVQGRDKWSMRAASLPTSLRHPRPKHACNATCERGISERFSSTCASTEEQLQQLLQDNLEQDLAGWRRAGGAPPLAASSLVALDKQQGVVSTGRLLLIKDNQVGGPACGQAEGAATCKVCRTPY